MRPRPGAVIGIGLCGRGAATRRDAVLAAPLRVRNPAVIEYAFEMQIPASRIFRLFGVKDDL